MKVSIDEAGGRLAELVGLAEAGGEVILTHNGRSAVKLVPSEIEEASNAPSRKRALIESLQARVRETALPGPCAARSQDFLYGDDGLPR